MQIVYPNCTTSFQIVPIAIGGTGRSVRCVRCQTVWFVAPPPPEPVMPSESPAPDAATDATVAAFRAELGSEPPSPPPEPAAESDPPSWPSLDELANANMPEASAETAEAQSEVPAVALADIPIPVESPPPPAVGGPPSSDVEIDNGPPPDIESVAARRARAAARKRRARWQIPLPVSIAALILLSVTLLSWRKDVVRHAPQMASFYSAIGLPVNLRWPAFTDVKIGNEIHDGVPVLVVEGVIVSTVSMAVDVPRLRFALRNASGAEVYAWTAVPSQPVLEPGQTLPFRSRLASPPAEGHDIQVRFFTRRDAVAGLR